MSRPERPAWRRVVGPGTAALALALSGLIDTDTLVEKLDTFEGHFGAAYRANMRAKLGLAGDDDGDDALIGDLLALMAKARADYSLTFLKLADEEADWERAALTRLRTSDLTVQREGRPLSAGRS